MPFHESFFFQLELVFNAHMFLSLDSLHSLLRLYDYPSYHTLAYNLRILQL